MTTTIIVKAHAWPVDVTPLDPVTRTPLASSPTVRVDPASERTVYVHSGMDLFVHEVQAAEAAPLERAASAIMKHFAYEHLPAHLQEVSRPIGVLARQMDEALPDGPEKSAGLRKLLEAKDCLVRAKIG